MAPPRPGYGLAMEVGLEVPQGSLDYWGQRLQRYGTQPGPIATRFGAQVLTFSDPHGLKVALVEAPAGRPFTPWDGSPVPHAHQLRGLHGASSGSATRPRPSAFSHPRSASKSSRLKPDGPASASADPPAWWTSATHPRRGGAPGVSGRVHHLAWRVDDEAHQAQVRSRVESAGAQATPMIDRFWFKSVYFREPGGVLFELATDGPGFAVDEDAAHLGETLVLPPWLEADRTIDRAGTPAAHVTRQQFSRRSAMKGFKQFILRGNVLDLAVAVVMGAAFGAVVTALVKDLLTPIIAAVVGSPDFSSISMNLNGSKLLIGDFMNAVIAFLMLAIVVYFFVVLPVNSLMARLNRGEAPPDPTTKKCPECLSDVAIAARRCAFCTSALV